MEDIAGWLSDVVILKVPLQQWTGAVARVQRYNSTLLRNM